MEFDMSDNYVNLFLCLIILIISLVYHYFNIVRPPILCSTNSKFELFLEQSMPILSEAYWPTFWCVDGRLQTAIQFLCPVDFHVQYDREIFGLDDGGQVALDWLHSKSENAHAPIVLLLPGISGDSSKSYIQKLAINAHECGFRCLVFNYRGRGNVELKTPKLCSYNDTTDLLQVVQHIKKRFPNAVVGACGTSMGAYATSGIFMNMCNQVLANNLRQTAARYKHVLDTEGVPWDMSEVLKIRTIQEFDEKLTIKMFGYKSIKEYYREASLVDKMHKIRTPVLCLNAADDPGQPIECSDNNDRLLFDNDKVVVVITTRGGHISHLEGVWPVHSKSSYMNRVFIQYFTAMFHEDSYKLFVDESP